MTSRYCGFLLVVCLVFPVAGAQEAKPLTAETRKAAVARIGSLLIDNYVFEDVAKQCATHLGRKLADGAFDSLEDVSAFAEALTRELQSVSHDKHMRVRPSHRGRRAPGHRTRFLTASWLDRQQRSATSVWPAPRFSRAMSAFSTSAGSATETSRPTVAAALKVLENVDALVVDLRNNGAETRISSVTTARTSSLPRPPEQSLLAPGRPDRGVLDAGVRGREATAGPSDLHSHQRPHLLRRRGIRLQLQDAQAGNAHRRDDRWRGEPGRHVCRQRGTGHLRADGTGDQSGNEDELEGLEWNRTSDEGG